MYTGSCTYSILLERAADERGLGGVHIMARENNPVSYPLRDAAKDLETPVYMCGCLS